MSRISSKKKKKVQRVKERLASLEEKKPPIKHRYIRLTQTNLEQFFVAKEGERPEIINDTIDAAGDELIEKPPKNIRIILQNPNGIRLNSKIDILPEVRLIDELQADIAAFPESKLAPDGRTKETLSAQSRILLGASIVLSSSAKRIHNEQKEYQPGGVVTVVTGRTTGRHIQGHCDPWG